MVKFTVALVALVVLCYLSVGFADDTGKKKVTKLQIGVKKRIDEKDCKMKSRKGDSLHMHYTVSSIMYS